MKHIVCDTNVLLSGLLWKGAPHRLLAEVERGRIVMFVSRELLEEVAQTLEYPKLRAVLVKAGMSRDDLLRWVIEHSTLVACRPFDEPVITADPSDDAVLACALAARVDAIVSGDKHLLDLRTFEGIPIVRPARCACLRS